MWNIRGRRSGHLDPPTQRHGRERKAHTDEGAISEERRRRLSRKSHGFGCVLPTVRWTSQTKHYATICLSAGYLWFDRNFLRVPTYVITESSSITSFPP